MLVWRRSYFSMADYGGFLFTCSGEEEIETLSQHIRNYRSCSVPMSNPQVELGVIELCLFSFDRQFVSFVALMRRAREIASAKYCLKFLKFVEIHAVSFSSLESIFTEHFIQTEHFPSDTDISLEAHIISTPTSKGKRIQSHVRSEII